MCIQLRCTDWKAGDLLDRESATQEGGGQILRPAMQEGGGQILRIATQEGGGQIMRPAMQEDGSHRS
jgi:predicted enzyme related to lactoylglutathione lyase